jgi:uncharacterized protein with HEPN domain
MDRDLQRLAIVSLIFVASMLAAICISFSQCGENIIRVTSDTVYKHNDVAICKMVEMSPDKFAYYYQVEKNLKAIEDSIPSLAKNIEAERAKSDSIQANLEMSVDIANKQKELLRVGLDDCVQTATQLEINNMYLQKALVRQRKITWIKGGAGLVLGILIKGLL